MTTLQLPADQLTLITPELLDVASELNSFVNLSLIRGEEGNWSEWLRKYAPDKDMFFMAVLTALISDQTQDRPKWASYAFDREEHMIFTLILRRLIAGQPDWHHYHHPENREDVQIKLRVEEQIAALIAITLHERHLGLKAGESLAASAMSKDAQLKFGSDIPSGLILRFLSAESLNHLTDLAWALDPNLPRNVRIRRHLYSCYEGNPNELEMRPPKTRHLPMNAQPATVTNTLRFIEHPSMREEPSWVPQAEPIDRLTLGRWPASQGLGEAYAERIASTWTDFLRQQPQLITGHRSNSSFCKGEALREPHLTQIVLMSTYRVTDTHFDGPDTPEEFLRAAHVLTELTAAAERQGLSPEDQANLTQTTWQGVYVNWKNRLQAPASAWILAAGLASNLRGRGPKRHPEWIHALMLADSALDRLAAQAGAETAETCFGIRHMDSTQRAFISALNQQADPQPAQRQPTLADPHPEANRPPSLPEVKTA